MTAPFWMWLVFAAIVAVSLVVDLASHRNGRASTRRAALIWSAVWIFSALAFAVWIGATLGRDQAEDFLTAYLLEKSLSIAYFVA